METLKTVVKAIVMSVPYRISVEQLQSDYREIEGTALPYRKLGYDSLDQMLRYGCADVVKVLGFGPKAVLVSVNSVKSEHVAKLVTEQKPARRCQSVRSRNTAQSSNANCGNRSKFVKKDIVKNECTTRMFTKGNTYCRPVSEAPIYRSERKEISFEITERKENLNPVRGQSKSPSSSIQTRKTFENTRKEKHATRARVLNILRTYQAEIVEEGEEEPAQISPINANITDICLESDKEGLDKRLQLQDFEINELEAAFSKLHISTVSIDSIKEDDENLDCSQHSSSDIFFRPKENSTANEAIPDFALEISIFHLDFPKFVVKYGTKIKPFEMPPDITVNTIISIYITEIHNPYRFWFHIYKESSDLDNLMNNIERFYTSVVQPCDYIIERELIQPGQVCAAVFIGYWHRAEILTNISEHDTVKVFFMDYGTVFDVEISKIKYLRTEFAKFPAFAFRGCLAGITPVRLHWTTGSSFMFLSKCSDALLYAKVCEIDSQNRIYYLTVCDTHSDKIVQINRELIKSKFALKSFEWSSHIQLGRPRMLHKREKYPTFDMLESGDYPTLCEIYGMEDKGIFYESITDKMIYYPHILNFKKDTAALLRGLPFYLLSNNPFANDILKELSESKLTNKK